MTLPQHRRRQVEIEEFLVKRIQASVSDRLDVLGIAHLAFTCRLHMPDQAYDELYVDIVLADGFPLSFGLPHWAVCENNFISTTNTLVRLIRRAVALQPKIKAILATAHGRALAALAGTAARIVRIGLARFETEENLRSRDIKVETVVECLDAALRPMTETLHHYAGRYLSCELRALARHQVRRERQLAKLSRLGAMLEVSAPAEAMIRERDLRVADVARDLLATAPDRFGFRRGLDGAASGLSLRDGVIMFADNVGPTRNIACLDADEVRIFDKITPERRDALLGEPASALFDHPALKFAGRIGRIRIGERYTDVFLRPAKRRPVYAAELESREAA